MTQIMWRPDARTRQRSHMMRFMQQLNQTHSLSLCDYAGLYHWSITNLAEFWTAVWRYGDIIDSQPWHTVLQHPQRMPGARWFAGSRLNFAENLLRFRDEHTALIFCGEQGTQQTLSYQELFQQVARLANALTALGVGQGDRVAALLPNLPQTLVAMLATTSLGAIWSSCSPDFGAQAVLERFDQITPKVLFTVDGYHYNGKRIKLHDKLQLLMSQLTQTPQLLLIPYINDPQAQTLPHHDYATLLESHAAQHPGFVQLPFDHPLYILYSSGTTGKPKCIIHSAGGTLLQHLKELLLHTDLQRHDRIFYFTTCGWMMWNWLASALACGSTLMLYEGSPTYPKSDSLFDFAAQHAITVFGTSARYLSSLQQSDMHPLQTHDLTALRCILSTGSPLLAESFDYVYRDIKPHVQLSSISGGTDIISCFALGCSLQPVYRGQLQCRGLGMAVEIFSPDGESLRDQKGELVCTAPFPSMPLGFWGDEDGTRFKQAYFTTFNNVWNHGDYAQLTAEGGVIIEGRSDTVLNPGGVRIGTAEIYRLLAHLAEISESLAISQEWQGDSRIVLFVCLRQGDTLDDALRLRIAQTLRDNASPRHVPAHIIQVPELPHTLNGKLVELAVRDVVHGRTVRNREALANPQSLDFFRDIAELAR